MRNREQLTSVAIIHGVGPLKSFEDVVIMTREIIVMLDEDEAGRFGREDIAVHVSRWAFVRVHVFGEEGKQPEQLTVEEVADLFD